MNFNVCCSITVAADLYVHSTFEIYCNDLKQNFFLCLRGSSPIKILANGFVVFYRGESIFRCVFIISKIFACDMLLLSAHFFG